TTVFLSRDPTQNLPLSPLPPGPLPADAGLLRLATASTPSRASANPYVPRATPPSTPPSRDCFHSFPFSVPSFRFSFVLLKSPLVDDFSCHLNKALFTASAVTPLVDAAPAAMNPTFARQNGHIKSLRLSIVP